MCATVTETCPRAEKCRRLTPGTVTWRRVTGDVLFGVYRGGREGWGSRGRNGVSDAVAWLPLPAEVVPGRARPPWSPAEGWASPAISPGRVTVLGARPAAHAAQRLGGRGRVWPSAGDIGDRRRRLCARPPAPAPATRPATAQDRRDQERARGSGRGQPGGHARGQAGGQPWLSAPASPPAPAALTLPVLLPDQKRGERTGRAAAWPGPAGGRWQPGCGPGEGLSPASSWQWEALAPAGVVRWSFLRGHPLLSGGWASEQPGRLVWDSGWNDRALQGF